MFKHLDHTKENKAKKKRFYTNLMQEVKEQKGAVATRKKFRSIEILNKPMQMLSG